MRKIFHKLIVMAVAAAMATGMASVVAYGATAGDKPISLDLRDVSVVTAIEALFNGTGKNHTVEDGITGVIPSLVISDASFDVALKILAKTAGLTYRIESDVYLIQKKQPVMDTATPVSTPEPIIEPTTTDETVIDKVPLSNTGATELLNMMNGQTSTGTSGGFGGNNSWGGGMNSGFGGMNSGFGGMSGGFGGMNSGFGGMSGGFGGMSGGYGGGYGGSMGGYGGRSW